MVHCRGDSPRSHDITCSACADRAVMMLSPGHRHDAAEHLEDRADRHPAGAVGTADDAGDDHGERAGGCAPRTTARYVGPTTLYLTSNCVRIHLWLRCVAASRGLALQCDGKRWAGLVAGRRDDPRKSIPPTASLSATFHGAVWATGARRGFGDPCCQPRAISREQCCLRSLGPEHRRQLNLYVTPAENFSAPELLSS